jgi:hypothetical protein
MRQLSWLNLLSFFLNQGFCHPQEYIATQGPKLNTCHDFWRMVLQEKTETIVMLTSIFENTKIKCHEYFPNLNACIKFANIIITCKSEKTHSTYIRRILEVQKVCNQSHWTESQLMFNYHAGRGKIRCEALLLHLLARPWRSFRHNGLNRVLQSGSQREKNARRNHRRPLQVCIAENTR